MHNLKVAGIIAEYNPFHRGHLYHIRKSRMRAQADAIIVVISSNFVQRGEPALADKETRTRMALACGADLALELPVVFSSHNAGLFANAAVDILAATGLVQNLCFGMETPGERLDGIADILNEEPERFRDALKKHLSLGYSFVQARSMALDEIIPGSLSLLKGSNNNLALAYVKRIREKGYPFIPLAIQRQGADYHDRELPAGDAMASASAIRSRFGSGDKEEAEACMPEEAAELLRDADRNGHIASDRERFWRAVKLSLLRSDAESLSRIAEMREGLENRMLKLAYRASSLDEFVDACTSRRYTKGRIQRYCTHLLIGLEHCGSRLFQENGPAYIRVLGANETGRRLLSLMRESAALPVVSRAAASFSPYAQAMMQFEHRASEIWELLTDAPRPQREARLIPVMA